MFNIGTFIINIMHLEQWYSQLLVQLYLDYIYTNMACMRALTHTCINTLYCKLCTCTATTQYNLSIVTNILQNMQGSGPSTQQQWHALE